MPVSLLFHGESKYDSEIGRFTSLIYTKYFNFISFYVILILWNKMQTVTIPTEMHSALKNELSLLKEQELLYKVNNLVDLLYESKYGLYLGDFTDELTQANMNSIEEWKITGGARNEV